jgi:hypothetical protein
VIHALQVEAPLILGDIIVIGGGCYGTFYARQLEQARERKKVRYRRLLAIDRNPACQVTSDLPPDPDRHLVTAEWSEFLADYLGSANPQVGEHPSNVIVPSPLMPHLMYEWLVQRARARWPGRVIETQPLEVSPGTPYDATAPDYTRYISFADWICPTHCTEPALCPVIRGPRTWEMSETLSQLAQRMNRISPTVGPVLFQCQHTVFGVGTFSVDAVLEGDRVVTEAGRSGESVDVLVGTISSCHGAVNRLHLDQSTVLYSSQ